LWDKSGKAHCCTGPVANSTHVYAFTTGGSQVCCPTVNVTLSTANVSYCCNTGSNWTNDNACCASSSVLVDGTYRACCAFSGTQGYVAAKSLVAPYNLICCPSDQYTVDSNGVKTCCGANTNWTSNDACCSRANTIYDTGSARCCASPVGNNSYVWLNSACCLSQNVVTYPNATRVCCTAPSNITVEVLFNLKRILI
jgi:hypothetical protein